ncbi:MAG: sigma-54-dependent Fis family transcriptional regulator [Oceanospirillales bacterium]|uniref:Transcriptional regulator of acetoin/glycerol metabolism n=1 Tax=Marinobacterium halophilum TaxID=267374 RepID=A0A2P8EQE9_9GAMM|nr:sigma-54-dependent Fis family transcriptional regulator [Marinobacterium halophilum]MBR9829958.1 sigma-54-dependent Fis family transcriptional regulator [Oceanospirillales bacterium]PSL11696.1 transcriptional regulator of acetoin/glycerol metabolism [Marinobacterium halophilum]
MAPRLRQDLISDPVHAARIARERLQSEGQLPEGYLRDEIAASWRRSLDAGLECSSDQGRIIDDVSDLIAFRDQHELLLHVAMPEIEQLTHQFGDQGLVLLANADARLLSMEGCDHVLSPLKRMALRQGVSWSEDNRGTNALGTAVVERRAIVINEEEHFLDNIAHFSCASSPFFDADGQLMGVLDLTRIGRNDQPQDTLGIIQLAARNIEGRLFASQYQNQVVIAFHPRQQFLRSAWQGLVALGEDGHVLAINEQGCQLLGRARELLVGKTIDELVGESVGVLLNTCLRQRIASVQTRAGELYCELLQFPDRLLPATPVKQISPPTRQQQPSTDPVEHFAADEPRLQRSMRMAARAMGQEIPVLLHGETGSGKEVAAKALHDGSLRRKQPFVAVNCAAIPEGLIESELFGYREGAFTGSRKGGMMGRFQQANGGTLFLDEIGDMPLSIQARLLRVLQERMVAPLGGGEEVALDIALIGATHRNLKQMVAEGTFREDLYYRLNGISVSLPALRERKNFNALCQRLLAQLGCSEVSLDPDLQGQLVEYAWPGNFRQLEMVLKVALAFMEPQETVLTDEHLSDDFLQELDAPPALRGTLQETQEVLIRQALEQHKGKVTAAAEALGVSRATLYRRMKALGID